jgi:hypothetical protein
MAAPLRTQFALTRRIRHMACLLAWSAVFALQAEPQNRVAELRAVLREHLKNPEFTLDRKPEYVVTDPTFIEPVLDQALKYIDAARPLSPALLAQVKSGAVTYYRLGLARPDGLKALETRIAERFAHPVVTRHRSSSNPASDAFDLDFGWVIGPLVSNTRYGIEIDFTHPKYAENFEGRAPSTRLLASQLASAARNYPTAERVSVTITFPRSRLGSRIRATYIRAGFPESRNGWVLLQSVAEPTTHPLFQVRVNNEDFSPYLDGSYSFYEDCAPIPGAARTPQTNRPLAVHRQRQCLS